MEKWFNPQEVETVIVAMADAYGRMMGKRLTFDYFQKHAKESGVHLCNYLLAVDMDMNPLPGFKVANWDNGFGDFQIRIDFSTLRLLPWYPKTAIILGDLLHSDGRPVNESPRQVLANQLEKMDKMGLKAAMGAELEFILFNENYQKAHQKGYAHLTPSSDHIIDYHILGTDRDEGLIKQIRQQMDQAGIKVECSKGECARGQYEVNLEYCAAMEMADRHFIYKTGAKEIATQHEKGLTFMSKLYENQSGNGLHIHTSVKAQKGKESDKIFKQFVGGLLKYSRELSYFFAPTINSYKRYQANSWAPTAIVCGIDNRTCGLRVVGSGQSLRVENRMPGADANPYLAFAATLAAGLQGILEKIESFEFYKGNAYEDQQVSHMPGSLEESVELLKNSKMAKQFLGEDVWEFYVHTGEMEARAFRNAVTDWEIKRYFQQL